MRNNDWYLRDEEDDFGEALHRRTEELYSVPDAEPGRDGLIECPVMPLRDMVVFPHMVSPIFLSQDASIEAVEEAQFKDQTVIALTQRDPDEDEPGPGDFFPIGVEIAVGRLLSMPDGSSSALVQGRRRVEVVDFIQEEPFLIVRARPVYEVSEVDQKTDATMRTALEMFHKCVQLDRSLPEEAYLYALNIEDPGWLADMIVTSVAPPLSDRMEILAQVDPVARLDQVIKLLAKEADVLELEDQLHTRAQSEVDRSQREFYLRERMKAIQTELGEGDPWTREINELQARVESVGLPEEVLVRALREVERLSQMPAMSPEVGIIRTYVEWILDLPW
ncbi:MAG: ATP-dependent protease La, partial [Chloroflexi bacterium]|nr:ATP-dependent protease La [Chloroflexota bacterium]